MRIPGKTTQVLDLLLLEVVAGHLHPHPVHVLRFLVDPSLRHLQLAVLLGQPEVDVVELVLAVVLSEVGAGEVAASLDPAQRPVDLDEIEGPLLAGLVILQDQDPVLRVGGNVFVDGRLDLPALLLLGLAGMLGGRDPPPRYGAARDQLPPVAFPLRGLVDADVDDLQLLPRRLQPEVEVVGLGGLTLGVEVHVHEVAVPMDAPNHADVVRLQLEERARLLVLVAERAVLLDPGVDVGIDGGSRPLLREVLVVGPARGRHQQAASHEEHCPFHLHETFLCRGEAARV